MSRLKSSASKARLSENENAIQAIWHSTVDNLRVLSPQADAAAGSDADVARLQREKNALETAIDQLTLLIKLRKGETIPPELLSSIVSSGSALSAAAAASASKGVGAAGTPGGSGAATASGQLKRKRRTSASYSASPAPVDTHLAAGSSSSRMSPHPPGTASSLLGASAATPLSAAAAAALNGGRGSTPMSREVTAKMRKEQYSDQLPLRAGRKVAFKVPKSGGNAAAGGANGGASAEPDDGEQEWILAIVKKCLNGDRTRYEVVDADDATDQAPSYNTTMRSIIPLPDPAAPLTSSAHPSNQEEYPRGSTVFAQYPETTSFYRATVMSAPLVPSGSSKGGGGGRAADQGAVKGFYRLSFVDDEDRIMEVHKDLVVKPPKTTT